MYRINPINKNEKWKRIIEMWVTKKAKRHMCTGDRVKVEEEEEEEEEDSEERSQGLSCII